MNIFELIKVLYRQSPVLFVFVVLSAVLVGLSFGFNVVGPMLSAR